MARATAVLANFQRPVVAVAGYYAPIDDYQHVIAATADNVVTEIWWRQDPQHSIHGQAELARFDSPIVAIAGYYADYDRYEHVIVATEDRVVTEIWWRPDPKHGIHGRGELERFASPIVAVAGYYSPGDEYEHVFVATADHVVLEHWWRPDPKNPIRGQEVVARYGEGIVAVAGGVTPAGTQNVVLVATNEGFIHMLTWPPRTEEVVATMPGITAVATFLFDGDNLQIIGDSGGAVKTPTTGGIPAGPYGQPNWGDIADINGLAAYYAPDGFNHVIVGAGTEVQDWLFWDGPAPVVAPPPSVDFTITPDDGRPDHAYLVVGESATMKWTVTGCQHCNIGLRGYGGLNYSADIFNANKLLTQGEIPVNPGDDAKYVLTATGDSGTTTKEVYVTYGPGAAVQGGQPYCFKLTADSFALPCLTYCWPADSPGAAEAAIRNLGYQDYNFDPIAQSEISTACD